MTKKRHNMNLCDFHSGKLVQHFEYLRFSPAKINHIWSISDPKILQLLSEADRSLGELNAYCKLVPQVDFFIRMHIVKEATQCSRIEGTRTNIGEAMLAIKDIASERRDDWQEIQNYIHANHYAIIQLDQLPLSNRWLKNTHKILLQGVRGQSKHPGELGR